MQSITTQKQKFWHQHVQSWLESGVIPAHYCVQHGLNPKNFSHWKLKIYGSAPKPVKELSKYSPPKSPAPLVAIPIKESNSPNDQIKVSSTMNRSGISLHFDGQRIELDIGFDKETLLRLLATLEKA